MFWNWRSTCAALDEIMHDSEWFRNTLHNHARHNPLTASYLISLLHFNQFRQNYSIVLPEYRLSLSQIGWDLTTEQKRILLISPNPDRLLEMNQRSLVIACAALPGTLIFCWCLRLTLGLTSPWLLSILAGWPLFLVMMARVQPMMTFTVLLPYMIVWQMCSLSLWKLKQIVSPPDLQYVPKGKVKRVAVIGAGSSGLTAAKEALQAGENRTRCDRFDCMSWIFFLKRC